MMKLKQVEQFLQQVDDFESPKIKYEQYATNSHLAAHMIFTAATTFDDIRDKCIADLGCGCGMLSIAATLMGAEKVYSMDIDPDALAICKRNLEDLGIIDLPQSEEEEEGEGEEWGSDFEESKNEELNVSIEERNKCLREELDESDTEAETETETETEESAAEGDIVELYNGDVLDETVLKSILGTKGNISTVLMNPPFGTKNNAGVDVAFLRAAISLSETNPLKAIYSMHKTSTREYLKKKAEEWKLSFTVIAEMKFDLPAKYSFHKKDNVTINVDLLRFGLDE